MRHFVLFNNGTIRRIRGTIGGNTAWKQHDEGSSRDFYAASLRSKRIAEIQDKLAADDLRDVNKNGFLVRPADNEDNRKKRRGGRNRNRNRNRDNRRFEVRPYDYAYGQSDVGSHYQPQPAMTSTPVVKKKARPAFRVIISESGKMCAVPLEQHCDAPAYA